MITTTTTNLPRLPGAIGGLVSLALLTACPLTPVETTADSESSTSSTSTTGATNQTATVTITTTSATDPTTTGSPTSSPTSSPTTTTTGDPVCSASDEFSCAGAYDCGESCGELGSRFDDEGCLRPSCSSDSDCGDGVCYGANWGLCTSSEYNCADASESCECDSTDDCGGNYCVPTSALPGAVTPPAGIQLDNDCSPDDGPAVKLEIGLADPGSACKELGDVWLRLTVTDMSAPLAPGSYPITQGDSSAGDPLGGGWLTIESWDANVVSGSYAVIFGDALYEGSFVDGSFCATPALCG